MMTVLRAILHTAHKSDSGIELVATRWVSIIICIKPLSDTLCHVRKHLHVLQYQTCFNSAVLLVYLEPVHPHYFCHYLWWLNKERKYLYAVTCCDLLQVLLKWCDFTVADHTQPVRLLLLVRWFIFILKPMESHNKKESCCLSPNE